MRIKMGIPVGAKNTRKITCIRNDTPGVAWKNHTEYSGETYRPGGTWKETQKKKAAEATLAAWQQRWQDEKHSRWTYCLLPDIRVWIKYRIELEYHTTQFLTEHGCFAAFRHRIDPNCWFSCGEPDSAEHHLMVCQRWQEERVKLIDSVMLPTQRRPTSEELMGRVPENGEYWRHFKEITKSTLLVKEGIERELDGEGACTADTSQPSGLGGLEDGRGH